jgi:hypothetical protein
MKICLTLSKENNDDYPIALYADYVSDKLGPELTQYAHRRLQGQHDGLLMGQWIANFLRA